MCRREPFVCEPRLGENLQDHLRIRRVYKTVEPTLNDELNNPLRKVLVR